MKNISYKQDVLERFIPVSRSELVEDLLSFPKLTADFKQQFQLFCEHYVALYHAQLQQQHSLIDDYLPFSPDRDTISEKSLTQAQYAAFQDRLFKGIDEVLLKANFKPLSQQQLNQVLNKTSPHGVQVSVNFDAFDEIILYYRGTASRTDYKRLWRTMFLKKAAVEVDIYRRVFILLKPKDVKTQIQELQDNAQLSYQQAEKKIRKKLNLLLEVLNGRTIFIKLFKDVPQTDLEMLFPNTRIRMRLFDKIKLSVTGGGGTIGGMFATAGKIAATIEITTMAMALAGFAGVLWRQISSVFNQRTKYMAALSQNLYYYNMDNNRGALAHIIELAEAEESKEAILSYFFLLHYGSISSAELDHHIEEFMKQKYGMYINFEVSDGIRKLKEIGLLEASDLDNDILTAIPVEAAQTILKDLWVKLFSH